MTLSLKSIIAITLLGTIIPCRLVLSYPKEAPTAGHPVYDFNGKKKSTSSVTPQKYDKDFQQLKKMFKRDNIAIQDLWQKLFVLEKKVSSLSQKRQSSLLQFQARLLYQENFSILAAYYLARALKISPSPMASQAWKFLWRISNNSSIQILLTNLAEILSSDDKLPPSFGTNWNFFKALAKENKGDNTAALALYKSLEEKDRYFFPSQYLAAMLLVEDNKPYEAEEFLKHIVSKKSRLKSSLSEEELNNIAEHAILALARIYYELKEFSFSISWYRKIDKDSPLFYQALFEQSWALFLGGFPAHALGALYATESPYYRSHFNPETKLLRSLVFYWLCHYNEAQDTLTDFVSSYSKNISEFQEFFNKEPLTPEKAYKLLLKTINHDFQDIPPSLQPILISIAESDSLVYQREELASVLAEKNRIEENGLFGAKKNLDTSLKFLDDWSNLLTSKLGQSFLAMLTDKKSEFDALYAQALFLHLEFLVNEKNALLGKSSTTNKKMSDAKTNDQIPGWGKTTQSWTHSDKNEYWWDEMGFYIYEIKSFCKP